MLHSKKTNLAEKREENYKEGKKSNSFVEIAVLEINSVVHLTLNWG